jgi:tetraacyldisaccharide 4'-kinase
MNTPTFWYQKKPSLISLLLWPIALLYQMAAALRSLLAKPYESKLPVICVGNFVVGGGGKTPIIDYLASALSKNNKPCILSRGYKGKLKGPMIVSPVWHSVVDVGDEPLMLAKKGHKVCVAKSKKEGAKFIEAQDKFDIILMDDGLQNPTISKDFSICVIKEKRGFGNGMRFPAGPIREIISDDLINAYVIWENDCSESFPFPVDKIIKTKAIFDVSDLDLKKTYLAFAGIAHPQDFFANCQELGVKLKHKISYPDHHQYSDREIYHLAHLAREYRAILLTTEKDLARIPATLLEKIEIKVLKMQPDPKMLKSLAEKIEAYFS